MLEELNKEWNNVQYDYVGVTLWGSYYSMDYITGIRDTFTEKEKDAMEVEDEKMEDCSCYTGI